ncbi:MAG: sporulation membrane protein YtaF [Syntrophobacteraceae bacterium]
MVKEAEISFILLMAISSNLDNVGVGIAYGARRISIPFASNLLIAAITTIGTFLSVAFGKSMSAFLKPQIANCLGSAILIGAGVWVAFYDSIAASPRTKPLLEKAAVDSLTSRSFFKKILTVLDNPCSADVDFSSHLDLRESAVLGLALTLNNLANGVGAGMIGLNTLWLCVFVFVLSIATILAGIMTGARYGSRVFGRFSGIAAGIILILIGLCDLML